MRRTWKIVVVPTAAACILSQGILVQSAVTLRDKSIAKKTATTDAIAAEAKRQQSGQGSHAAMHVQFPAMDVCTGSPVPAGWIVTDSHWSPTQCGNPTTIYDNVLTLTQYSGLAIGSALDVCFGQATPTNWVVTGGAWNPTRCGHPTQIYDNITTIKRLQ